MSMKKGDIRIHQVEKEKPSIVNDEKAKFLLSCSETLNLIIPCSLLQGYLIYPLPRQERVR